MEDKEEWEKVLLYRQKRNAIANEIFAVAEHADLSYKGLLKVLQLHQTCQKGCLDLLARPQELLSVINELNSFIYILDAQIASDVELCNYGALQIGAALSVKNAQNLFSSITKTLEHYEKNKRCSEKKKVQCHFW